MTKPFSTAHGLLGLSKPMTFGELETVVLERDIPERGLRKGARGAVVELYDPEGLEVEYVRLQERTRLWWN
jgi:hypothetical protein